MLRNQKEKNLSYDCEYGKDGDHLLVVRHPNHALSSEPDEREANVQDVEYNIAQLL